MLFYFFLLTGHLDLCSSVYNCSHPVSHDALIQASVSPLRGRDGQPKNGQTHRQNAGLGCVRRMQHFTITNSTPRSLLQKTSHVSVSRRAAEYQSSN